MQRFLACLSIIVKSNVIKSPNDAEHMFEMLWEPKLISEDDEAANTLLTYLELLTNVPYMYFKELERNATIYANCQYADCLKIANYAKVVLRGYYRDNTTTTILESMILEVIDHWKNEKTIRGLPLFKMREARSVGCGYHYYTLDKEITELGNEVEETEPDPNGVGLGAFACFFE